MGNLRQSTFKILISLLFTFTAYIASAFTVVIDPGHGGGDHGATEGTIIESKIALQVALKLANKLQSDLETKVILTRQQDASISLKQRVKISASNKADLFISLHGNSSSDRRAKGAEFYFGGSTPPKDEIHQSEVLNSIVSDLNYNARLYQSQSFAAASFNLWKESNLSQPRAIKQAPFFVINRNSTPSILVEFGFITNAKEAIDLLKDETQDLIATNLYAAVKAYRNNKPKIPHRQY